jgi:hypothetical protein
MRYLVTERRGWCDETGAIRAHEVAYTVRPFEGKRPKGRVYESGDIWIFDELLYESDRPPFGWAFRVETCQHIVGCGKVPADWRAIEERA